MYEYLPLLIVGAIIGVFSLVFILAYALIKNKKEAIGFDRNMKDSEIAARLLRYARPHVKAFLIVLLIMLISIAYDLVSPLIRPTIFRKAASLIESGWIPKEGFGYRRHFCPICKTVESRFHFRLEKDGKSWFPTFKCGKCQSHLVPITGNHPPGSLRRRKEEECSRYIRCTHCGGLIDIQKE